MYLLSKHNKNFFASCDGICCVAGFLGNVMSEDTFFVDPCSAEGNSCSKVEMLSLISE